MALIDEAEWKPVGENAIKVSKVKAAVLDFRIFLTALKDLDDDTYERILTKYKEVFGEDLCY